MTSLRPSALENIRDDSMFELEQAIKAIRAGGPEMRSGRPHAVASLCHRRLAMVALLVDADQEGFHRHLCHSGDARLNLLHQAPTHLDPVFHCASKELAFIDVLVAGQMDSAVAIAALAAKKTDPSVEYEDDFLLQHFLHQMVLREHLGNSVDLQGLLTRWTTILEGNPDPYLDVCQALLDKNDSTFETALKDAIEVRKRSFDKRSPDNEGPNDELRRTEGAVFMTGLAFLRLAELQSLATQPEYPTIPSLGRLPLRLPPPPIEGWMIAV